MQPVLQPGDPEPGTILVVLPTWVGDFVMATPTLRAVRNRFPAAEIVFLMEPNLTELVRGGDWMDAVVAWPEKRRRSIFHRAYRELVRDLRRRHFDWAVLLPNSFRSALLARLSGARRRIGYDRDGRGRLLTDRIPVKNRARVEQGDAGQPHGPGIWPGSDVAVRMGGRLPVALGPFAPIPMVEYYADLAEAIGCPRPGDRLELFVTPDCEASVAKRLHDLGVAGSGPLAVISPGAKFGASKCWMPDRFAAVADRLIETHGATVVVTCGPGEEAIACTIRTAARQRLLVFDEPLLTLGELKSLIRRCDLLLCNDAGPRHLAKAFNVPVVTIFGPTHPDWTATGYPDERIVRTDIDCGPCQQKTCPLGHHECMTAITPDPVYDAAVSLLQDRARQRPNPASRERVHG